MSRSLEGCEERLEQLEEENAQLKRAAESFGLLAERLNMQLSQERRQGNDRRRDARPGPDRRQRNDSTPPKGPTD
jgi:hypothetical protein